MIVYRAGHVVYLASSGSKVKHPWHDVLRRDDVLRREDVLRRQCVLSEAQVRSISEVLVSVISVFSNVIVRVVLVESFSVSVKVLVGVWVVGAYIEDVYLVLVCVVCVVFVGPVWYKRNQAWCDDVMEKRFGKSKED